MKFIGLSILVFFLSACQNEPAAREKKESKSSEYLPDSVYVNNLCRFFKACSDPTKNLDSLISDEVNFNGKMLNKNLFIRLMQDSLKKNLFVNNRPKTESIVLTKRADKIIAEYKVNFESDYQMQWCYSMSTVMTKSGLICAHSNHSDADTTCLGIYKTFCRKSNSFPVIYLYNEPYDRKFNEKEKLPADSIVRKDILVRCYNTASLNGDLSEFFIYVSYKGKKYWALAEDSWTQHEDYRIDSTLNPPVEYLPYSVRHTETYFEKVK